MRRHPKYLRLIILEEDDTHLIVIAPGSIYMPSTKLSEFSRSVKHYRYRIPKDMVLVDKPLRIVFQPNTSTINVTYECFAFNSHGILETPQQSRLLKE